MKRLFLVASLLTLAMAASAQQALGQCALEESVLDYIAALCAAQEADRIAQAEAQAEKERIRAERRAARANDPAKQAHGPIPEKSWIISVIFVRVYKVNHKIGTREDLLRRNLCQRNGIPHSLEQLSCYI